MHYDPKTLDGAPHVPLAERVDLSLPPAGDDFNPGAYDTEDRKRRMPPGQTLAKKFPHLEYASIPQIVDPGEWKLRVFGEVANPFEATASELAGKWPVTGMRQDFHCITGWSVLDTDWQGVDPAEIIQRAAPAETVTTVMIHGLDEFSTCVWLQDFLAGLMAYGYRGRRLAPQHGFPLRFVAPPHLYQYKACKWVTGLEFMSEHRLGFWEIRAYSDSAQVWQNDRYANPAADEGKPMGSLRAEVLRRLRRE